MYIYSTVMTESNNNIHAVKWITTIEKYQNNMLQGYA